MIQSQVIRIVALDQTKKAFNSATKGLASVTGAVFSLKTALGLVAGATGFGYLVKSQMNAIDVLAKTAGRIGTTTDALSKLQYAGQLTGVSTETMNMALQRFVRRTAEASQGTGEAVGALRELGINARQLQSLPLDERMEVLADAFGNVKDESDQLRLAFKLFDSEGASLVNTLRGGSGALSDMYDEAETLGLVMQQDASEGVERANDELTKLFSIAKGVAMQFAGALAPAIGAISEYFREMFVEIGNTKDGFRAIAQTLAVDFLNALIGGVNGLESFVNSAITLFNDLANAKRRMFGEETEQDAIKRENEQLENQIKILGKYKQALDIQKETGDMSKLSYAIGQLIDLNPDLVQQISDMRRAGASYDELNSFIDTQIGTMEGLKKEYDDGTISFQKFVAIIEKAKAKIGDTPLIPKLYNPEVPAQISLMQVSLDKLEKSFTTLDDIADSFAKNTMNGLTQALTDGVTGAKSFADAFKSMAKSVVDSLIKMLVQYYITQPLFLALQGYLSPSSTSAGGGTINGDAGLNAYLNQFKSGNRAYGGSVSAGQPYMVGERGKEIFIPNTNGAVVNTDNVNGSGVVINQTIQVTTGVQQTVKAEIMNLMPQIANSAKQAVADARMRGGSYHKSLVGA